MAFGYLIDISIELIFSWLPVPFLDMQVTEIRKDIKSPWLWRLARGAGKRIACPEPDWNRHNFYKKNFYLQKPIFM